MQVKSRFDGLALYSRCGCRSSRARCVRAPCRVRAFAVRLRRLSTVAWSHAWQRALAVLLVRLSCRCLSYVAPCTLVYGATRRRLQHVGASHGSLRSKRPEQPEAGKSQRDRDQREHTHSGHTHCPLGKTRVLVTRRVEKHGGLTLLSRVRRYSPWGVPSTLPSG